MRCCVNAVVFASDEVETTESGKYRRWDGRVHETEGVDYWDAATLGGKPLAGTVLRHEDILAGKTLTLDMHE